MGFTNEIIGELNLGESNYESVKEILKLLDSLIEARNAIFDKNIDDLLRYESVESDARLRIPITKVQQKDIQYKCITSDIMSNLEENVMQMILTSLDDKESQIKIAGMTKIVSDAIRKLIEIPKGAEQSAKICMTVPDGIPIVRMDYVLWCRRMQSEYLEGKMDVALSLMTYKSVIGIYHMKFDDFCNLYMQVLNANGQIDSDSLFDELEKARKTFIDLGASIAGKPDWFEDALKNEKQSNLVKFSEVKM